eukprot:m.895651 g.895651  ORF g.895651 m.895651 type:complete len:135 (-) comp23664_c1_seq86:2552-2956(-)
MRRAIQWSRQHARSSCRGGVFALHVDGGAHVVPTRRCYGELCGDCAPVHHALLAHGTAANTNWCARVAMPVLVRTPPVTHADSMNVSTKSRATDERYRPGRWEVGKKSCISMKCSTVTLRCQFVTTELKVEHVE